MHNSLGIAANTAVTEVHLPSELLQGICVRYQRWDMHYSLGITANTAASEVHLPSELPQGISVRCVV
ncbi:hypothetical protein, partial [Shewanella baltica]|uniref:hypothetical protein n=1 Tax=Shewanella baltica TaxID=62322 RepID=UPI0039B02998